MGGLVFWPVFKKMSSFFNFKTDGATIRKSAINSVLIQLILKAKGLITMPIMTYYLMPSELGVFNLISVTAMMLSPLFSMNLTDGPAVLFVQEKNNELIVDMYNTVVNSVIIVAIFCSIFLYAGSMIFGGVYQQYVLWVIALVISQVFFKVASYVLAVFQQTTQLVRNAVIRDVSATLLTIILVIIGYSYQGIVVAAIFANLAAGLLIWRLTRADLPYCVMIDFRLLLKFLKMALPLLPVFFFSWVIQSSDSYFLAYLRGESSVGRYSVAYGITSVVLCLTYALNFFWYPVSSRLWVENRIGYNKVFKLIFAGFFTVLLVIVCLFELNSALIVRLFVQRIEYYDAYKIMGCISFAFSMQVLITLLTAPLYSNRNTKAIFFAYLIGGILNVILNFLLIPRMGIVGAAVSTAFSYLIIVIIMGLLNFRLAVFSFIDHRLKIIVPSLVAFWLGMGFVRDSLSLAGILLLDIVFLVSVFYFVFTKLLETNERSYLCLAFYNYFLDKGKK